MSNMNVKLQQYALLYVNFYKNKIVHRLLIFTINIKSRDK